MVQARAGSGNVVPLMVRVPEDLRDRIKAAAEANGRSQNSEIVATLEEKYPDVSPDQLFFEAEKKMARAISLLQQDPDKNKEALRELAQLQSALAKVHFGMDRTHAEVIMGLELEYPIIPGKSGYKKTTPPHKD